MRKAVRITAWILALLILLQVGSMVVLQSPRVQTFLGKKVIDMLQDSVDADITFASASIRPFDAIVLDDVLIKDVAPTVEGMDTLLYVRHLSARFSLMGYFRGDHIALSRAKLDGGCFHLVLEQDPDRPGHVITNLQRIFRIKSQPHDDSAEYHWGDLIQARSVEVSDVHFQMENLVAAARHESRGIVIPEGTIDWNHLNLILEHIRVNHFRMSDDILSCSVQDFFVHELETDLRMDNLSAKKVRVGKGNVHLDDFIGYLSPDTFLDIASLDMDGRLDEYDDFENNVSLDVVLRNGSFVDMHTVSHFAPGLDEIGFRGRIRGRVQGPVSRFAFSDIVIESLNDDVRLRADGRMTGLPDAVNTQMDFQIHELSFGLKDLDGFLQDWAPEVKLNAHHMAPGERFTVSGTLKGILNRMTFTGDVDSNIGTARANITLANAITSKTQPMTIGGSLQTADMQMGRIIGNKELGAVSLNTRMEAVFARKDLSLQVDTLHIHRLQFHGYDYGGIQAFGHYRADDCAFQLVSTDPNLRMQADGAYHRTPAKDFTLDATLNLEHADLEALQLDKRGRSRIALNAHAGVVSTDGHTTGQVVTTQAALENGDGRRDLSDITLDIEDTPQLHRLSLRSGLMDADFEGERSVTDFLADLQSLVLRDELSALTLHRPQPYSGASYTADLRINKLQDLLTFIVPGLYVESGTQAHVSVSPEGLLNAELTAGRLALRDQYIKGLRLHADNQAESFSGAVSGSTIALSAGTFLNNSQLHFQANDNRIGLGYSFDNEAEEKTHAELQFSGELERSEKGLAITARALPSNICFKGEDWGLTSGDITYDGSKVHVNQFLVKHGNQQLLVDGGYSSDHTDTLSVTMDRFDIALVNDIAGDRLPRLEGHATGHALIVSTAAASAGLLASIVCDSTAIAGRPVGQLTLNSDWDEQQHRFNGQLSNFLEGRSSIQADVFLVPSTGQVQVSTQLDRFELGYAEHFLNTIFHEFSGALSGEIKLDGKLNNLRLSSQDLWLDDGRLNVDFIRVPYQLNGPLSLDGKGLHFKDMYVTDGEGGTGTVSGGIFLNLSHLDDIRMDTHVKVQNLRVMELPRGVNPVIFGNVYATGHVDITGPLNKLTLAVDATSTKSGDFHLPLGSATTGSSRELLTFTDAAPATEEDPYEQMMAQARQTRKQQSDFRFYARIKATPDLSVNVEIGEDNSLNAIGAGTIELESRSSEGSFTMGGDYTIQDGNFHFSVLNLVSRNFTIQDGSTIRFNGDIWDTDLDVKGRYTTKASLSNLLPSYDDSESASGAGSRRTVYCGINISGKIKNPEVNFDIEVPDLNPMIQGQVETALNSEDKIQKQFVYLLIAGNFLPTEESGVTTNSSDVLLSNVTSIMSGQLNNIFQKLDIPLDLGLNYQTTQTGLEMFDVAVSTQLFNNRVIVNGTVGNKHLAGGATTNEVSGDLDIEIKLNRSGSLRMSLFSHSADQYTYYLDNSQRNGGGIAYQREFNSFGQFFREIFSSRKQREAMALEAATRPQENVVLQIDSTGKSKIIHEVR